MIIVIIRAIILYFVTLFAIRLMGKKQLGELQPSELVITIMLTDIATLPIQDLNLPMFMGIVPILVFIAVDILSSFVSLKSKSYRKLLSGTPQIIIRDGTIDQKKLKELRFTVDDLFESMRQNNIFDISEIQFAIVETTGSISLYQKFPYQTCTAKMMHLKGKSKNPPQLIIEDGKIINDSLNFLCKNEKWVINRLTETQLKT